MCTRHKTTTRIALKFFLSVSHVPVIERLSLKSCGAGNHPIRNLMRRCCNDYTLADDLTQQVFLKVWLGIRKLRKAPAFSGWLKRVAVSVWLQHIRKKDALGGANEMTGNELPQHDTTRDGPGSGPGTGETFKPRSSVCCPLLPRRHESRRNSKTHPTSAGNCENQY